MTEYNYRGRLFRFKTDKTLFSPIGIEKGTVQILKFRRSLLKTDFVILRMAVKRIW